MVARYLDQNGEKNKNRSLRIEEETTPRAANLEHQSTIKVPDVRPTGLSAEFGEQAEN